jgi:heat shock protein HslJ
MIGYNYLLKIKMNTKLKSFILTALLFAMLSPGYTQQQVPGPPEKWMGILSLTSGTWYLVSDSAFGMNPEISFRKGHFNGYTGCNRMSGSFTATDTTLHFDNNMITTKMYCAGYNESAFLQNLLKTESYGFKDGLMIFYSEGIAVSEWTKAPPASKKNPNN